MLKPLLAIFCLVGLVCGQRRHFIQTLVDKIKSGPKHYSISPSFHGERKFEVIGTGELPLQSDPQPINAQEEARLNKPPSINDVIKGNLAMFENSGRREGLPFLETTESDPEEENEDSQGSGQRWPPGIRSKGRRRQPGGRRINQDELVGDRRVRNRQQEQDLGPEFVPDKGFHGGPAGLPPRRHGQGRKHFQPPGLPLSNPMLKQRFKRKPAGFQRNNRPLTKNRPRRPEGPGKRPQKKPRFHPPQNVFNGFEPSFQSSKPFNEQKMYNHEPAQNNVPRRRQKYNDRKVMKPNLTAKPLDKKMEDNIQNHFNHMSEYDQPRQGPQYLAEDEGSPFTDEMPFFRPDPNHPHRAHPPPPQPNQPNRPGPERPKRQRPHKPFYQEGHHEVQETGGKNPFQEQTFNEVQSSSNGFFHDADENFPDFEDFGIGWEPQKIRRKRAALNNPFYYSNSERSTRRPPGESRRPRRGPRPPVRRPGRQPNRRQGPSGFWDDDDFDADFFNNGSPSAYSTFDAFSQQQQFNQPGLKRPFPRPQITSKKYESSSFSTGPNSSNYETNYNYYKPDKKESDYKYYQPVIKETFPNVEDNSLLGSGNFEVLKGGTFYDQDDYRRPYSNNQRPQTYSYYGNNDIFDNFRDFADIKGEKKRHQESFYYK